MSSNRQILPGEIVRYESLQSQFRQSSHTRERITLHNGDSIVGENFHERTRSDGRRTLFDRKIGQYRARRFVITRAQRDERLGRDDGLQCLIVSYIIGTL